MRRTAFLMCGILIVTVEVSNTTSAGATEEDVIAFAVVSELPKDKTRVPAKVAIDGSASPI